MRFGINVEQKETYNFNDFALSFLTNIKVISEKNIFLHPLKIKGRLAVVAQR